MMRFRHVLTALLMGVAVLAAPGVATAAYPGANGRIAFEQGGVIYSIRADGSDRRQLTSPLVTGWPPDRLSPGR
jgi:hypothetical protein